MHDPAEMSREEERRILVEYKITPEIFDRYGLKVMDIVPKRGIYRIETDQGFKCLKKMKSIAQNIYFTHAAIEHLVSNGFFKVSRIRRTTEGNLYLNYENGVYFIMDWIDGRECDYENPIELDIAVKTLVELHKASKGFQPSCPIPHYRDMLGKWPQIFKERSQELLQMKEIALAKKDKTKFDEIYLKHVDAYYEDSLEAMEGLKGFDYDGLVEQARKDQSFCHNDYAYHNILISYDHQDVAVLDFDYCIFDLRINDIGSIIHRNLKKCNWDMERAEFIINSYHQASAITADELKGLYVYLRFPSDFWRISNQYYLENKDWDEETFIGKIIEKSEWKELREDFLKNFKKITGI